MGKTILTEEGRKKMQEELEFLSTSEKNRAIMELSDARERGGGVEENSEYLVAKEEYEKLQSKISKLRDILSNSIVVSSSNINTDKVSILCNVKVINTSNNKEMNFTIVPENEIDIKKGKISHNSPIGAGLIGKKINDVCDINTPNGVLTFKILDIS